MWFCLKRMGMLLVLLLCLALAGCSGQQQEEKKEFRIVTSFYPVYIDVINITKGIDGVSVVNMTKPQTGCLHDYQLTTEDMRTLESADVFVINGGGMEGFMEKAVKQNKELKVIDASKSDKIKFLKDGDEPNPHVWMSVTYAMEQVKAITFQLCELDPAHDKEYRKNALDYVMKLESLRDEMHADLDGLPHKDMVTFHEAFPYFAKEFKLNIVDVVEREPGTEPSPQELESTIEKVKKLPVKVLFTEPQYSPKAAETIAREAGASVYSLDPIVTGESNEQQMDAYILAMKKNAATLKEALGY